jgi:hypothetical protein
MCRRICCAMCCTPTPRPSAAPRRRSRNLIRGRLGDGAPAGRQAEVALAAKLRILSLACLVRDHVVDDWIKPQDANGMVLFHRSLFLAAAAEPLLQLPNGDIGFDPARFRRRVLKLAAVQGSA